MINFFTLPWSVLVLIVFILGACVFAQTLALVLNFFRNRLSRTQIFQNLLEVFILFEMLVFAFLHGQMINAYKNGFFVPSGYENIRILIFLGVLILVVILSILMENLSYTSIIPAAIISLPAIENIIGGAFHWFFIAALIFFLIRSIKVCISSINAIKTNISALSVIRAVDTLDTGLLFSESDGHILLSNYQMQNLMIDITGEIFRNSIDFYNMLTSEDYNSKYKKTELDDQLVYLLPNGSAWMFTKTDIDLGSEKYIHISGADVSENWALTNKLQLQDEELRKKSNELKNIISNLQILSKEKEIENAKMRAHDILGQRLSVLLRIIQNDSDLDYDLLTSLSKGLLAEIKAEQKEIGAYDELRSIQQIFGDIGINIEFKGELPHNTHQADLFIDIIREASTNAVRHGLATEINIKSEQIDDKYNLTVSNNGYTMTEEITPGSGIKLMRKKISREGGILEIKQYPTFTLSVVLPGGD